jgi:hypothetical protein
VNVYIAINRDKLNANPSITVKICVCADILMHVVTIMIHRHMELETRGTTPDGRAWRGVNSTAKNL